MPSRCCTELILQINVSSLSLDVAMNFDELVVGYKFFPNQIGRHRRPMQLRHCYLFWIVCHHIFNDVADTIERGESKLTFGMSDIEAVVLKYFHLYFTFF